MPLDKKHFLAHPSQSKSSYVGRFSGADSAANMDKINLSNEFYADMFSLDFDSILFPTPDLESFWHFVIDTINSW